MLAIIAVALATAHVVALSSHDAISNGPRAQTISTDGSRRQAIGAGTPTMCVFCDVKVAQLEKVDGVDQTFVTDFTVLYAFPTSSNTSMFPPGVDIIPVDPSTPGVSIVSPLFPYSADTTEVSHDVYMTRGVMPWMKGEAPPGTWAPDWDVVAWITKVTRFQAKFKAQLPLHDFPFDEQLVSVTMQLKMPAEAMQWGVRPGSNFTERIEPLLQWTLVGSTVVTGNGTMPGIPFNFSEVHYQLRLRRDPSYYLNKIVSGIVFLCVMNLFLFLLDASDSNRLAVGATVFLAIVAYLFLVSSDVPKVAYATKLDNFIQFSMIHIFTVYVVFCLQYVLDKVAENYRLDDEHAAEVASKTRREYEDGSPTSLTIERLHVWPYSWLRQKQRVNFVVLGILSAVYAIGAPLTMY